MTYTDAVRQNAEAEPIARILYDPWTWSKFGPRAIGEAQDALGHLIAVVEAYKAFAKREPNNSDYATNEAVAALGGE